MHTIWAMYILGLCSSWGTSRICPSWSPSEHLLTPALSPFGASVRSHSILRRLFIVLTTAAHISPNVFSLRMFLSNTWRLFFTVHNNIIHTYYTSHSYAHLHFLFYMSYLYLHFFWSSWQAGCSRTFVSDTDLSKVEKLDLRKNGRNVWLLHGQLIICSQKLSNGIPCLWVCGKRSKVAANGLLIFFAWPLRYEYRRLSG